MLYSEFRQKCSELGIDSYSAQETVFRYARHTFRAYARKHANSGDFEMPPCFDLLMLACEDVMGRFPGYMPKFEQISGDAFADWCEARSLLTYDDIGGAFFYSRQAVWNWYHRHPQGRVNVDVPYGRQGKKVDDGEPNFPGWLPMACYGYDVENGLTGLKKFAGDKFTPEPRLFPTLDAVVA